MKTSWSVTVIYEDVPSRQRAVEFCNRLVERFWAKCGFEVSWLPFSQLQELEGGRQAAEKAKGSDFIIFASRHDRPLTAPVASWIESWLQQRGSKDGMLVCLLETGAGQSTETTDKHVYFRNIAHRAGLDYLVDVPQDLGRPMPDSLDSFSERAHQVTGVLSEILQHKRFLPSEG